MSLGQLLSGLTFRIYHKCHVGMLLHLGCDSRQLVSLFTDLLLALLKGSIFENKIKHYHV